MVEFYNRNRLKYCVMILLVARRVLMMISTKADMTYVKYECYLDKNKFLIFRINRNIY